MKKLIIAIMLLAPLYLYADVISDYKKEYPYLSNWRPEGKVTFQIKSMHQYVFHVKLKGSTQYCFMGEGEKDFHFQIIEASGNGWEGIFSRNARMISLENIMDKGYYIINIYSFHDNKITLYWGEY